LKNFKQLIVLFYSFLIILSAAVAVSAEPLRPLPFDDWAERADVYFFNGGGDLYRKAGTLGESARPDDISKVFNKIPEKKFLPWPEQLRVSGFGETAGGLIIGINGGFPLEFDPSVPDSDVFIKPEPMIRSDYQKFTSGMTLATVFTEEHSVYFHFYRDDLFSKDGGTGNANLLRFDTSRTGGGALSLVTLGFADDNPEWEPVEFINTQGGSLTAWKYSDDKKTRFRYIRHAEDGAAEKEIDENYFRDAYQLIPFDEGSFALRGFVRAVREGVIAGRLQDAGDVYLKLSSFDAGKFRDDYPAYFYDGGEGGSSSGKLPVFLSASGREGVWFVLSENKLIRCDSNITVCSLPSLPSGFKYKELWTDSEHMIVSWEETRFPYIGRSGMMYIGLRDILNN